MVMIRCHHRRRTACIDHGQPHGSIHPHIQSHPLYNSLTEEHVTFEKGKTHAGTHGAHSFLFYFFKKKRKEEKRNKIWFLFSAPSIGSLRACLLLLLLLVLFGFFLFFFSSFSSSSSSSSEKTAPPTQEVKCVKGEREGKMHKLGRGLRELRMV